MSAKWTTSSAMIAALLWPSLIAAQTAARERFAERYVDVQAGLSLDAAIRLALDQEPLLKSVRADLAAAQGRRLQATLRPNPSVSVEQREEPGGTDTQSMVQVQWPLDLFRRGPRIGVADAELATMQPAVDERVRQLKGEVRDRYGAAAAAIRALDLADRAIDVAFRQFELVRQRAEQGAVPTLERDQADVELRRLEAERLLSVGRVEATLVELQRAIGSQPSAALRLRDSLDALIQTIAPAAPAADNTEALASRPDVRGADAQVKAAEARAARVAADGRWDLGLFGGYTHMATAFPQTGLMPPGMPERVHGEFTYLSIGAMVSVPLWNRNQGEIAASRADQAGAAARSEATRLAARAELSSAEASQTSARRALTLVATTTELAAKNLDIVRQTYELGRSTITEWLTEQRRYLEIERAQADTMKALYDAHVAVLRAKGE